MLILSFKLIGNLNLGLVDWLPFYIFSLNGTYLKSLNPEFLKSCIVVSKSFEEFSFSLKYCDHDCRCVLEIINKKKRSCGH